MTLPRCCSPSPRPRSGRPRIRRFQPDAVRAHGRPRFEVLQGRERSPVALGHDTRCGSGVNRRDVMYNDFIIVGPSDDPATINGTAKAGEAFKARTGVAQTSI